MPQAPKTAVVPTADALIDAYLKALGGADALAKVTSYAGKGTSTTFGADQLNPSSSGARGPFMQVMTDENQRSLIEPRFVPNA